MEFNQMIKFYPGLILPAGNRYLVGRGLRIYRPMGEYRSDAANGVEGLRWHGQAQKNSQRHQPVFLVRWYGN